MKKTTLLFSLLLGLSAIISGQTYFNERYNLNEVNDLDFCNVVLNIEQGYLLPSAFVSEENTAYNSLGLLLIDTLGNKLQVKLFGDGIYSYNYSYKK